MTRILQLVWNVNRVRTLGKCTHCTYFDLLYLEQGAIQGLCGIFSHFWHLLPPEKENLGNFCMVAFSFSWRLQDRFLTMWLRLDFHTALVNSVEGDCALFSWTTKSHCRPKVSLVKIYSLTEAMKLPHPENCRKSDFQLNTSWHKDDNPFRAKIFSRYFQCQPTIKGRVRLPNRMNFWKSAKGGGRGGHFLSKSWCCRFWEFWDFKQAFLIMKLIQNRISGFRVCFFQKLYWEKSKQDTLWSSSSHTSLRERSGNQNGWIFGKVPNGSWPPPLRMVPISENHVHVFHTIWPSYLLAYMPPYLS